MDPVPINLHSVTKKAVVILYKCVGVVYMVKKDDLTISNIQGFSYLEVIGIETIQPEVHQNTGDFWQTLLLQMWRATR